jgi:hypothetical protein
VAQQLTHPLPILRYYAAQALEQILGSALPFDLHQDNSRIEAEARRWLTQSGVTLQAPVSTPAIAPPPATPDDE